MEPVYKLDDVIYIDLFPLTGKSVSVSLTYRQVHGQYLFALRKDKIELTAIHQKIFARYVFHPAIEQMLDKMKTDTGLDDQLVCEWSCYCVLAYCIRYVLYGRKIPTMHLSNNTLCISPKLVLHE